MHNKSKLCHQIKFDEESPIFYLFVKLYMQWLKSGAFWEGTHKVEKLHDLISQSKQSSTFTMPLNNQTSPSLDTYGRKSHTIFGGFKISPLL